MRELMLENAEGKRGPSHEASCTARTDKHLGYVSRPFCDRCEGGKCKDRARRKISNQLKLPSHFPERREGLVEIISGVGG
jgi:hypothetical protein